MERFAHGQIFTIETGGKIVGWLVEPMRFCPAQPVMIDTADYMAKQGAGVELLPRAHIKLGPAIVVYVSPTSMIVVDGNHRLRRAFEDGLQRYPGALIDLDFSNACRIPDAMAKLIHGGQIPLTTTIFSD